MTDRVRVLLALALVCAGVPCAAAGASPAEPDVADVRRTDADTERRSYIVARARISHPQDVSVGAAALVVRQPADHDCATPCYFRGLLVQLEPGLAGGQISAGYAVVVGQTHQARRFVRTVHVGYAFKGAVLRTWGDAERELADATWAGAESEFTIVKVNFSLGAFYRVSGESEGDRWLLSGGIGWGF